MKREPLLQLQYRRRPWRLLVTCVLLNQTGGVAQVKPVLHELFERWPTPKAMMLAGPELEEFIRPLGLWRRRAKTLRDLSLAWHCRRHRIRTREDVLALPGIGPYAADAWEIVCRGRLHVEPDDKELTRWVRWARTCPPRWARAAAP